MLTTFSDLSLFGISIGFNPQIVMAIIAMLMLGFLLFCFLPALLTWGQLIFARSKLNKLHQSQQNTLITKNDLSFIFEPGLFQEAWNSYKDTLHEQYEYKSGMRHLKNIRATAPAEAFFNQQTLVDSRINIEFFRHLPGILTAIGLIGIFWGLIHGMHSFDPTLLAKSRIDPAQKSLLFDGLKQLFFEVRNAFIVSAVAIAGAILVTMLEKVSINACYYRLEKLCLKLDAMYDGGAAEAYLAEMVKFLAENATHADKLKAGLVTELSELLRELSAKQMEHSENLTKMLIDTLIQVNEKQGQPLQTAPNNPGNESAKK